LQRFKEVLDEGNVHNLMEEGGPRAALEKHLDLNGENNNHIRIISCGGDGTTGWILSVMDSMNIPAAKRPYIGIIPLGTGNDLARVFNWGGKFVERPLKTVIEDMSNSDLVRLDRWTIETTLHEDVGSGGWNPDVVSGEKFDCTNASSKLPMSVLNNYYSIGIDAYIAYKFHDARDKNPEKFTSRNRNRLYYTMASSKETIRPYWGNLMDFVTIVCDDVDYTEKLKSYKANGILILNILSYAGGCRPWNAKIKGQNSMDDGLIEVIALDNLDLAVLQSGFHAKSVVQCKKVVISTTKVIHMKVDGEPVFMKPCSITIQIDEEKTPAGNMLRNKKNYVGALDRMENLEKMISMGESLGIDDAARKIQKCWRHSPKKRKSNIV